MSVKDEVMQKIMMHKARVSIKMSDLANDLGARGRRHDNSYTGDNELAILMKIRESDNASDIVRYEQLLHEIHAKNNDCEPDFHKGNISEMNMFQLIEYIVDKIAYYDEMVVNENAQKDFDHYKNYVLSDLNVSDDLRGVIEETVLYVIDRNKSIVKNLAKETNPKYEVIKDGETKTE